MTTQWLKISSPFSRQSVFTAKKIESFQQARELMDEFICFYNYERIRLKTGETPLARCLSA